MHHPSRHNMENWPRHLRETTLVERLCRHGVGHPDPTAPGSSMSTGLSALVARGECTGVTAAAVSTHHDYADLD